MNLRKKVKVDQIYSEFVNIINGVLRLSNRTAEVFSLLLLYNSLSTEPFKITKQVRANIKSKLNITDSNLSHIISNLKKKSLVVKGPDGLHINKSISPTINSGLLEVTFTLDTNAN